MINTINLPEPQPCTVRDATYQFMRSAGCRIIFGNPGSTELPMFRAFPEDFEYVLGLQEASVVGMADGYAQAARNASFVNLHSAAGVGNAMGNIYTAFKNQTPMVIIAGQQARSIQPFDAYLYSRQAAELPQPYVKWSIEPARAEDVPKAIAKAYQLAMQQPCGPVLVSVPSDDWDQECQPVAPLRTSRRTGPDPDDVANLRVLLESSQRTAIVVGAAIDRAGAWEEIVELAEVRRAAVYAAPMSARCSFPETHPAFQGFLPAAAPAIRRALHEHDLILVVGAPAFTYHVERDTEGSHIPEGARLAVLTDDGESVASVPEGVAVQGDVQLGLRALLNGLPRATGAAPPLRKPAPAIQPSSTISVASVLRALAEHRSPDDIIVEEAPTARVIMHQYLPIVRPGTFYTMASGGLGFSMPAAVGVALAQRDKRVICVIGDGSSMYSIQCLWTAAQQGANVLFIVLNNQRYGAMKRFAGVLGFAADEKVVGIEIPGIEFSELARAQGCAGEKIIDPEQVEAAIAAALEQSGPRLMEFVVD